MKLSSELIALALAVAGGAVTATGVALIFLPAGVIAGGLMLLALGLFLIPVGSR